MAKKKAGGPRRAARHARTGRFVPTPVMTMVSPKVSSDDYALEDVTQYGIAISR